MAEDVVLVRPVVPAARVSDAPRLGTTDARGRSYDADVYGWAMDQAAHIRAGRYDLLDIENLAEEIESLGRQEFNALTSNLEIVLLHMLKWDFQSARRSRSWAMSIAEHRRRVIRGVRENPSLTPRRDEALEESYELARIRAANETDLPLSTFPVVSPFTWTDILERSFVHGIE